jgi:hypothetical protein
MMQRSITALVGLSTLGLALTYASAARWGWVAAIILVGLPWLTEPWHGQRWVATMGMLFFVALATAGAIMKLPRLWLFSILTAVLVAWDLDQFSHYLSAVDDVRNETQLIKGHGQRLGIVVLLGWLLSLVALRVQLTFHFILTLALSLLVVVSLSRAIRYTRRENGSR